MYTRQKTKVKVNAWNNIIRKLANHFEVGIQSVKDKNMVSRALLLCCRHGCPVWTMTAHASKLTRALCGCCRVIRDCLKPAYTCWPVLLLILLGDLLQAAWRANDRRLNPATNYTAVHHLIADRNHGKPSSAQCHRSTTRLATPHCRRGTAQ